MSFILHTFPSLINQEWQSALWPVKQLYVKCNFFCVFMRLLLMVRFIRTRISSRISALLGLLWVQPRKGSKIRGKGACSSVLLGNFLGRPRSEVNKTHHQMRRSDSSGLPVGLRSASFGWFCYLLRRGCFQKGVSNTFSPRPPPALTRSRIAWRTFDIKLLGPSWTQCISPVSWP